MAKKRVEHIRLGTERISCCGVAIGPEKSAFFGVDNAIRSMQVHHDVQVCYRCARAVIAWLEKVPEAPPPSDAG